MTLAEFQPYVEAAVTAHEWATARARWRRNLLNEQEGLANALRLDALGEVQPPLDREPYEARLQQVVEALAGDVTADQVPISALRSVPMDLIAAAVVRRILRLPADLPVLSIKATPSAEQVGDAVAAIAQRWSTPQGEIVATL